MTERRRRRKHPKQLRRRRRFGATFKANRWWLERRLLESPEVVAAVDWLVFRRSACPYRACSYRARRYLKEYAVQKALCPTPGFKPLTQASPAHGKPPQIYTYHLGNLTIRTPRKLNI